MDQTKQDLNFDFQLTPPTGRDPTPQEFLNFKKRISSLINLDLTNYKNTQMERRIKSLMFKCNIPDLDAYYVVLKKDPKKLEEFINMLTINVTEFFRNQEKFVELEERHLPELLEKNPNLRIWSSGCSIGAEIYSIAMILDKMDALARCTLIASDFDEMVLNKAKSGIYSKFELKDLPAEYEKYFTPIGVDKFQISPKLTSKIFFRKQDLLNSKFEKDFDLICCRNVVIYFTDAAKDKLYEDFYASLKPGGVLFIGSTERINKYREIGFNLKSSFFYQK